jgi:hypothetical protein
LKNEPLGPPTGAHDVIIEHLFAATGPLSSTIDLFRQRTSQVDMAKAVARAIEGAQVLVAEAGTGTGKTFAYLVPALLWGGKVILSTGTKNLQDQLFLRDIPTVRKALSAPVTVALLKGRSNYLCPFHLERTIVNNRLTSRDDVGYLRAISRFAKTTQTGDKAELTAVPENALIWNLVTSTRDNCLGSECAHYQDCFVTKARREAQQADVVVVNHHLFFADVALKDRAAAYRQYRDFRRGASVAGYGLSVFWRNRLDVPGAGAVSRCAGGGFGARARRGKVDRSHCAGRESSTRFAADFFAGLFTSCGEPDCAVQRFFHRAAPITRRFQTHDQRSGGAGGTHRDAGAMPEPCHQPSRHAGSLG